MSRSVLTLFLLTSVLPIGCSDEDPQIAGTAVVLQGQYLSERLVISTGNEGQAWVTTDDRWYVECYRDAPPLMKLTDLAVYDHPTQFQNFAWITMDAQNDPAKLDENGNVIVFRGDDYRFRGTCDVKLKEISNDPYEAEFSASDCDLRTRQGTVVRLESAKFRVKSCDE